MAMAVLFDLDDTLHDRLASLRDFLVDQHRRHLASLCPRDTFTERFLQLDNHGRMPKAVLYPQLLDELGIEDVNPRVLADDYGAHFHGHARHMDGALPTLRTLRRRGLKLGVITNGWTNFQLRVVTALGLADAVDLVVVSEAEGLRKPDPRIFLRAAERLGVSPEGCLFVGDNPEADVIGADGAGMRPVWLRRSMPWPAGLPPTGTRIDALTELVGMVA